MMLSLIIYAEENSKQHSMGNLSETERRKGENLRGLHSEDLVSVQGAAMEVGEDTAGEDLGTKPARYHGETWRD